MEFDTAVTYFLRKFVNLLVQVLQKRLHIRRQLCHFSTLFDRSRQRMHPPFNISKPHNIKEPNGVIDYWRSLGDLSQPLQT